MSSTVKPMLKNKTLVRMLKSRGLIVSNPRKAHEVLSKINYQRFSAYRFPFLIPHTDKYINCTCFEDIYASYTFDKELRILILDLVENIEVELRARITYYMGHKYGHLCHMDETKFRDASRHNRFILKLTDDMDKDTSEIVSTHRTRYTGDLPIYKALELVSMGTLSQFFSNLLDTDQDSINKFYYQCKNNKIKSFHLRSWFQSITQVRNACAHHSVLFFKYLSAPPKEIRNAYWFTATTNGDIRKLFGILLVFKEILHSNVKWQEFLSTLEVLINNNPQIKLEHMGLPSNWRAFLNI